MSTRLWKHYSKHVNMSSQFFLTFQVVWVRGAQAGKHNRQRQPPLRRAGPRPACQRHRQLRLEDDRLAEAMSADGSLWDIYFFCYLRQFDDRCRFPSVFFDSFANECKRMNARRSMCGVLLRFSKRTRELFFVDGLLNGYEEVRNGGAWLCVTTGREVIYVVSLQGNAGVG